MARRMGRRPSRRTRPAAVTDQGRLAIWVGLAGALGAALIGGIFSIVVAGGGSGSSSAPSGQPATAQSSRADPTSTSPATRTSPGSGGGRTVIVSNQVTNGATRMREDTPSYLSTLTRSGCRKAGCMLSGTELGTGDQITATCQIRGNRVTNGEDDSVVDDNNPGLYTSTLWYGIRWPDGRFGYIAEVWLRAADRGGLGLQTC